MLACQSGGLVRSGGDKTAPAAPTTIADAVAQPAPVATTPEQAAVDPKKLAEVEATVAKNNDEAKVEREHFAAEGWTIIDGIAAPDMRILTFDGQMMGIDPDALRTQLASTTPTADDLLRVVKIVEQATSPDLRITAIEALGRMKSEESQAELVKLLSSGKLQTDEYARLTASPLVRPKDLDDPGVPAAAALLDSPLLGEVEKNQIAFTLAAISLRDGTELPDSVLAALSQTALQRLATMKAVAQN